MTAASEKRRVVLFVDDEQGILDGLRDLLRRHRRKWDMHFVLGARAAVEALGETRFDVIVTDMRMPELDGADLLVIAQKEQPESVRVVLSGQTNEEAILRTVGIAHQFLSKPCSADAILRTIERAANLQDLIKDEKVRQRIGHLKTLPSLPHVYLELTETLRDPMADATAVGNVLKKDMTMCAKVLQMVNSGFFRVAQEITDINQAVARLGPNTIKCLVLSAEAFSPSDGAGMTLSEAEALQKHALLTASIAQGLVASKTEREEAFMAGMLHEIGKLVMAAAFDGLNQQIESACAAAHAEGRHVPRHVLEEELAGISHPTAGAYLVGLWGLPFRIVEAVAYHHNPLLVEQDRFDILSAVYIASQLAQEIEHAAQSQAAANDTDQAPELSAEINNDGHSLGDMATPDGGFVDTAYLERLSVVDALPGWRAFAKGCCQDGLGAAQ